MMKLGQQIILPQHQRRAQILAANVAARNSSQQRGFAAATTVGQYPERYFMVEYSYVQDAYYKRIPVRDEHLEALEKLKTSAQAKIITAPLFPYSGSIFFI